MITHKNNSVSCVIPCAVLRIDFSRDKTKPEGKKMHVLKVTLKAYF